MDRASGYQVHATLYESPRTIIYRGVRAADELPVVIKSMRDEHPAPREVAELRREFRVARRIRAPGVLQVYALEPWLGRLSMIQEDFGGTSLASQLSVLAAGDLHKFFAVALAVTRALADVHTHVIHGDVTPSNILCNPASMAIRLTDFGFASEIRRDHRGLHTESLSETSLPYVSPERTGRMNRDFDHRSDLYSLGVTLYQLLTGALPFAAKDRAGWIYSHVTRRPAPPSSVNQAVPDMLSRIVLRLLEKNPEERYQTARGLLHDLEECERRWLGSGSIGSFVLGRADEERELGASQRLCGREAELSQLLREFETAAAGASRAVLIGGEAGVGKSALVHEIRRPIFGLNGYFIEGKFDQFQRPEPYAAFAQAVRQLVTQVLTEPEERLARWTTTLRDTLGPNGQLVVDLVPEMERVIGPQQAVVRGNPVEEQNRFHTTIGGLIRAFSDKAHPLVLFFDDLQWSDEATLSLIESLLSDQSIGSFLFIGALRPNEVEQNRALVATIAALRKHGRVEELKLEPLGAEAVSQFVSFALHTEREHAAPLVEQLLQLTHGNALFLSEALQTVHRAGALSFDAESGNWRWDLPRIASVLGCDGVADLMGLRVRALSASTRGWLCLASCISTSFDLNTLALVGETTPVEVAQGLSEAVRAGLIVPLGDDYRLAHAEDDGAAPEGLTVDVRYRFQHDYAQQAVHALLSDDERRRTHRRIGRTLLERTTPAERDERLIEIVHQLNEGIELITEDAERLELCRLNLAAARKAMGSAAYVPAFRLLRVASGLLPANAWQTEAQLAQALHEQYAACAYLAGQLELAEQLSQDLLARAKTPLEKARVHHMRLVQLTFCHRMDAAIAAGREGLRCLGIKLSQRPSMLAILTDLMTAKARLGRRSVASLADAPVVTDPATLLCLRILIDFLPPAYLTGNDKLFAASVLRGAILSLKHGSGPEAASAYASYVVLLAGLGDLRGAHEFGTLALTLTERFGADSKCRNQVLFAVFGHSWNSPWREMRGLFEACVKSGLESGDMLFTAYACGWVHLWDPDVDVRTAWEEGKKYLSIIQKSGYQNALDAASLPQQLLANLLGQTEHRLSLSDSNFDEQACLLRMERLGNVSGLGIQTLYRVVTCLLYEEYERGFDYVERPGPGLQALAGSPYLVEYTLHAFLVCASVAKGPRGSAARQKMKKLHATMRKWAEHCPENFAQHAALMDAERAALRGDIAAAARLYSEAIAAAERGGFARYEALGNERAARFFGAVGLTAVAAVHLKEARRLYARWGAVAKVDALDERYSELLGPIVKEPQRTSRPSMNDDAESWPDVETIWRASRTLSEEVALEKMLERLMVILREHGGATRGVLILREHDSQQFLVQAETYASGAVIVLQRAPLEEAHLPVNLVRYAIRTGEPVVVADAAEQRELMHDPYLRRCDARSLLAMPIVHGGTTLGVLYLENQLAAHVFTPERLATLGMLSSQAAISLQNARLYEHLHQMTDSFSRFVPREFLRSLGRAQFVDIRVGESVQKTMTVLFSDVRGFTALVEGMTPEQNVDFVNQYISYMEPAILANAGFVDSYIGDAIMALFDRTPEHAIRAALGMLQALEEFNTERVAGGLEPVAMGIGLNTGPLTLGTIGGTDRFKFGVIGDTVNVASRIEGLTKRYGLPLLISGQTWVGIPPHARRFTRFVDRVRVAGHAEPTDLFEVFDADPLAKRDAKVASADRFRAALDLFYARRFAEARAEMQALAQALPGDPVVALFEERAARLLQTPPGEGWTGVEILTEK